MKWCLWVAAVFFLLGLGAACGDLSEVDDERIREFVKTAKRVFIDELTIDGNTQEEIDDKIAVIVDVLQGDSGGGTTTPTEVVPACRETGRKTVVMFRDHRRHAYDYLNDVSGFACEWPPTPSAFCTDGDEVCECEATDTMNPVGSTSFTASCTEEGGDGDTFNFTAAETLDYDAPSGSGIPPSSNAGTYRIEEQNQNQKNPGAVFPITVVDSRGTTVRPSAQASLAAYDSSGSEIDAALARWKTVVGANIYDVSVAAGASARFKVFLVRETSGVAKIGGTVDGTPIAKVTLTAGNYSGASDILVVNDTSRGNITFLFSGAARTALNAASKVMTYVITDANGEVIKNPTVPLLAWDEIPRQDTLIANQPGSCVEGQYVMLIIGSDLDKVYLPRCEAWQ